MSGYQAWGARRVEIAKAADAAALRRYEAAKYEEYEEYRAESRACGNSPESFQEWLGEVSPKAIASERYALAGRSLGDQCYYGDVY